MRAYPMEYLCVYAVVSNSTHNTWTLTDATAWAPEASYVIAVHSPDGANTYSLGARVSQQVVLFCELRRGSCHGCGNVLPTKHFGQTQIDLPDGWSLERPDQQGGRGFGYNDPFASRLTQLWPVADWALWHEEQTRNAFAIKLTVAESELATMRTQLQDHVAAAKDEAKQKTAAESELATLRRQLREQRAAAEGATVVHEAKHNELEAQLQKARNAPAEQRAWLARAADVPRDDPATARARNDALEDQLPSQRPAAPSQPTQRRLRSRRRRPTAGPRAPCRWTSFDKHGGERALPSAMPLRMQPRVLKS